MLLLLAVVTPVFAPSLAGASHVNIMFIVADDLNCAIGPYGDTVARTPNLDRLAARGLVFNRAYCQQAVCNPSRSSFLTGLRPDKVGVDDLRKYFRETAPNGDRLVTLPQHFKNHDYYCQDVGKIFHNMGETQDRISWSIDEAFYKGTHAADTVFFNRPERPGVKKPAYKAPVTEALDVPDTVYRDGQITRLVTAVLSDRTQDANQDERPVSRHSFAALFLGGRASGDRICPLWRRSDTGICTNPTRSHLPTRPSHPRTRQPLPFMIQGRFGVTVTFQRIAIGPKPRSGIFVTAITHRSVFWMHRSDTFLTRSIQRGLPTKQS